MARGRSAILLVLAFAAVPSAAQEQEQEQSSFAAPRSAAPDAERDRKAAATEPPSRSKVERALYRYDNGGTAMPFLFRPWHGLHVGPANFPAGAGMKIGVGFTHDLGGV